MKRPILLLLLLLFLTTIAKTQIRFKEGYFIDNSNQRIDCLIKDSDWRSNPTEFEYKLSEGSGVLRAEIFNVKQFEIFNSSKYIRALVNIDRSAIELAEMSRERNPVFQEELLFLRVLVAGKASLYEYTQGSLTRFFYNLDGQEINQLVFKLYRSGNNQVFRNELFKQQLFADLQCQDIRKNDFDRINYTRRDLVKIFSTYNQCNDADFVNFVEKKGNDQFHLSFRPGLNISNLFIEHISAGSVRYGQNQFPVNFSYRLAAELEYVLPFYARRWSIILEPTYRYQKWEDNWETTIVAGGIVIANVDYRSLELPIGFRYYFHLSNSSRLFLNGLYVRDFPINSVFDLTRMDGTTFGSRDLNIGDNFALGAGFRYNDKLMLEFRYHTPRHLMKHYASWGSDYKNLSVIFGYTLF